MKVTLKLVGEEKGLELQQGEYEIYRGAHSHPIFYPVFIKGPGCEKGQILGDSRNGTETVSHRHLGLIVSENEVKLQDIFSRNGSYIEGRRFEEETLNSPGTHYVTLGHRFTLEFTIK